MHNFDLEKDTVRCQKCNEIVPKGLFQRYRSGYPKEIIVNSASILCPRCKKLYSSCGVRVLVKYRIKDITFRFSEKGIWNPTSSTYIPGIDYLWA